MKRLQISLRMTLLLVAFLAVLFAWQGVLRNHRRATAISEIKRLQIQRKAPTAGENDRKRMFTEIDAEIAKRREILGDDKALDFTP